MRSNHSDSVFVCISFILAFCPNVILSETIVLDKATSEHLNMIRAQEDARRQMQQTQRVTTQQQPVAPTWVANQKKTAEMHAISNEELAKQRTQYNACKTFVGDAQKGAYDGRSSRELPGQPNALLQVLKANQNANKCPPELLRSRPLSEWQK